MRKYLFLFVTILIFSSMVNSVSAVSVNIIYKETIESYTRIDGVTYRWESEREFVMKGFEFVYININNVSVRSVKIQMQDTSGQGQLNEVIQPLKAWNFDMSPYFLENGSLNYIDWTMYMFRDVNDTTVVNNRDPFNIAERSIYSLSENRRYDLNNTYDFFRVNLLHYEYLDVDGQIERVRVDTDLVTNNDPKTGRVDRTSFSIFKRNSQSEIIFRFRHMIQEVSYVYRLINYLDQPWVLIPLDFILIYLAIYLYNKTYKFFKYSVRITRIKNEDEVKE